MELQQEIFDKRPAGSRRKPLVRHGMRVGSSAAGVSLLRENGFIIGAIILLIVSLCYKMVALGVVVLAALGYAVFKYRSRLKRFDPIFLLALAYVADATATSFLVSFSVGLGRTVQFCFIALGLIGLYAYAQGISRSTAILVTKAVGLLCIAILLHTILWHVAHHHLVTWKYLSDTKFIFSVALLPLFALEDYLKERGKGIWILSMMSMFLVILLSGERKALLLFVIIFLLSNTSIRSKAYIAAMLAALCAFIVVVQSDGYVYRQITSISHKYSYIPTRYFFSVRNIVDDSDMIRAFVNRNAWQLFTQHPWMGLGSNGYISWASRTYGEGTVLAMNVHGELYRVPVEGGLLGIAIVGCFLAFAGWRIAAFVIARGGLRAPSLDRGPLYIFACMICYCHSEALDTAMLLLVGTVGIVGGTLPRPSRLFPSRYQRLQRLGAGAHPGERSGATRALAPRLTRRLHRI